MRTSSGWVGYSGRDRLGKRFKVGGGAFQHEQAENRLCPPVMVLKLLRFLLSRQTRQGQGEMKILG